MKILMVVLISLGVMAAAWLIFAAVIAFVMSCWPEPKDVARRESESQNEKTTY